MKTRSEKNKKIQDLIFKEEKQKLLKKISKIVGITLGTILLIICYGMFIGAKIVLVHEHKITNNNLPITFHGLKIVHFSDLLYPSFNKNDLDKLEKQINELKPDIIIFTGDIKKKDYELTKEDIETLENFFENLQTNINKYAVIGNQDDDSFHVIMENSHFKTLNNNVDKIYKNDNEPLQFIGINTNEEIEALETEENFSICMFHNPDQIENILNKTTCHIALAGDTLGGEIKLITMPLLNNHKYNQNYYKIDKTKFFISNGLGNETNIRLFNHPSINLYRLTKY